MPLTQAQRAQVAANKAQAEADQTAADAVAAKSSGPGFATNGGGAAFGNPNISAQGKKAGATPSTTTGNGAGAGSGRGRINPPNAGPPADDSGTSTPTPAQPVQSSKVVTPNILSNYSTYTYNLSLHVLTVDDYNAMVQNPAGFVKPSFNLISEANRYSDIRDVNFRDDFYFEDLKMTTVVGLNSQTKASNAIDVSFTIIEPYGMTLLNRILDLTQREIGASNYLDNPYLLEINFFGADDSGVMKTIPNQRKWIPIKLTGFKIKATVKGAEYAVKAVPFNYTSMFATTQFTKANFSVTAQTVGQYFSAILDTATITSLDSVREQNAKAKAAAERAAAFGGTSGGGVTTVNADGTEVASATPPPASISTSSFTAAYNFWNIREQLDGQTEVADQITFVIDDTIAQSSIVDPNKNNIDNAPATGANTVNSTAKTNSTSVQGTTPVATLDLTSSIFQLNAGTSITAVIDMVMMRSSFIQKQLRDPSIENKSALDANTSPQQLAKLNNSRSVQWYKVIPSVQLTSYDHVRQVWGRTITYHIQPYTYYNDKHPSAPISLPPQPVKTYQYIYTGQNTEVISFDIDFNALYFTAIQVDRGNTTSLNKSKTDDSGKNNNKPNVTDPTSPQPVVLQTVGGSQGTTVGGAYTSSAIQNANNVAQSVYANAGADMITLKLQILGDPEFIKQDDIMFSPTDLGLNYNDQFVKNSGSIAMDNSEIYCTVIFKTPVDFDDSTGLLGKIGNYTVSYFSGYYRVLTVQSEFRGGKFTQSLDLVRYAVQPPNGIINTGWDNTDLNRNQDAKLNAKSQNPAISNSTLTKQPSLNNLYSSSQNTTPTNDDNFMGPPQVASPLVLPSTSRIPSVNTNIKNVVSSGPTLPISNTGFA